MAKRALHLYSKARFAIHYNNKSYDRGSIFKLRNANELNELLAAMTQFDLDRIAEITQTETVTISFRDHLLSPNPKDVNRLFPQVPPAGHEDDGLRLDLATGDVVPQQLHFRRQLERLVDANGNLTIPFDTTLLEHLGTRFFTGPNYSLNPISPGTYRDKIEWLAVNVVASDGAFSADTSGRSGSMLYAGETFFRTRIPPLANRDPGTNITAQDMPGDFISATFRRPVLFDFNNVFTMQSFANTSIKFAYNEKSATDLDVFNALASDQIGFKSLAFKEYSVAATQWTLNLNAGTFDISKINDIELVMVHRSTDRVTPTTN